MSITGNVLNAFRKMLQPSRYDSSSYDVRVIDGVPTYRDAFGRLRISQPQSIFENKNYYYKE